jgi:hypothetical protein
MTRRAHGFAQVPFALAAFSLVAACSSAGLNEPAPGSTEESLDRQSEGLHAEGKLLPSLPVTPPLAPPVPILVPPPAPPGASSSQCIVRTNCALFPVPPDAGYTVPGFETIVKGQHREECTDDVSFTDQLTAMGCTAETNYSSPGADSRYFAVPIAFCPHAPVDTTIPWEVMPCDSCTGQAPPGWVIIAWTSQRHCTNGGQPGGSCDLGGCLPAITD